MFIRFLTFWIILFTGKYPKNFFDYNVKLMRYQLRVSARLLNMADGYPEFGLNGSDTSTQFDYKYQEDISRGTMLVRALFGAFYVGIPHGFVLMFRMIALYFIIPISFFAILFTGKYPKGMFDFMVGTFRWAYRIQCYLNFFTGDYPPFTGQVLPGENEDIDNDNFGGEDVIDDVKLN